MTIWHVRYPDLPRDIAPKLVAVAWDGRRLTIKTLAGKALPASVLLATVRGTVGQDPLWWRACCAAHAGRQYPGYTVESDVSPGGARNYVLRCLRDEKLADWPAGGRLHVSRGQALSDGVSLWAGDIPPLLNVFLADFGQEDAALDVREQAARVAERSAGTDNFGLILEQPGASRLEGYHALGSGRALRYGDGRAVVAGGTLAVPDGPIVVGRGGLHAARTIARAVEDYRQNVGTMPTFLCRVALGGDALPWDDNDRSVSAHRTCVEMRRFDDATYAAALLAHATDKQMFAEFLPAD